MQGYQYTNTIYSRMWLKIHQRGKCITSMNVASNLGNMICSKDSCPDLAEFNRRETITAVELSLPMLGRETCYLSSKTHVALWRVRLIRARVSYHTRSQKPRQMAGSLMKQPSNRFVILSRQEITTVTRGGGETYHHLRWPRLPSYRRFLTKCEDNDTILFGFMQHTIDICQLLNGKPFLSHTQHFQSINNELSYWAL